MLVLLEYCNKETELRLSTCYTSQTAPVLLYGPPPLLSGPSCSRRDIYCDVAFEWLNVSLADAEALAVAAEHTKHGMELTAQGSARLSSRSSISSSARTASSGGRFHPFIITSWPKRRSLKSLEVVYSMRSSAAEPRRCCSSTRASAFHSHDVYEQLLVATPACCLSGLARVWVHPGARLRAMQWKQSCAMRSMRRSRSCNTVKCGSTQAYASPVIRRHRASS